MKKILITNNKIDRLDNYLCIELNISRSQVKKLIEKKQVYVNDNLVNKAGVGLEKNSKVEIEFLEDNPEKKIELKPLDIPIEIVYETDDFMILNKPSGLLIHPTTYNEPDTLAARLKYYFNLSNNQEFEGSIRPGIVHRLDRDTSGLIIVAKHSKALEQLEDLIKNGLIKRKYYAIVHNCFDLSKNRLFKIETTIGRSLMNQYKMQVNSKKDAKNAITILKVIKNIANTNALVECELITGRTHQIRVHLQYINHPIVNDKVYGIEKECTEYGQYLMCHEIEFINPFNLEKVYLNLDLEYEFKEKIKDLEYGKI